MTRRVTQRLAIQAAYDAPRKSVIFLVTDKDLAREAFNFTPCHQMLS